MGSSGARLDLSGLHGCSGDGMEWAREDRVGQEGIEWVVRGD